MRSHSHIIMIAERAADMIRGNPPLAPVNV